MTYAVTVAATMGGCGAYQQSEIERHREGLDQLLTRKPTFSEVEAEIGVAPYRVGKPANAKELAHIWTNPLNLAAEVEEKVAKWPQTRVYLKSPMVYFIYFDSDRFMRDFSCLSN